MGIHVFVAGCWFVVQAAIDAALEGPPEVPAIWSHVPDRAIVADTSSILQNDAGNSWGLCIGVRCPRVSQRQHESERRHVSYGQQ